MTFKVHYGFCHVLFHNTTCYTTSLLSHIHVNIAYMLNTTCILDAIYMMFRRSECTYLFGTTFAMNCWWAQALTQLTLCPQSNPTLSKKKYQSDIVTCKLMSPDFRPSYMWRIFNEENSPSVDRQHGCLGTNRWAQSSPCWEFKPRKASLRFFSYQHEDLATKLCHLGHHINE